MPLPERLLEYATHLATRDLQGRPRQDNLRRAISTANYSLFHFLVDQASRSLVGAGPTRRALRGVLNRAFDHTGMKRAAAGFASGTLPGKLMPALAGGAIPRELRSVAVAFRTLQDQRHTADYDLLHQFWRREALEAIAQVEDAIRDWNAIAQTDAARLFLIALLVGDRIRE